MRVLFYEPDHTGHHFVYVAHLLPDILEIAEEVLLATTPTAARSKQFQLHLAAHSDRLGVDTSIGDPTPGSKLRRSIQRVNRFRGAVDRLRPDHIYVPYGDGIAQLIGLARLAGIRSWPRTIESEVLLMRGGYQYPANGLRRRFFNAAGPRAIALGPWTRIHHLNSDDLAVLKRHDAAHPERFRLLPDPGEPPPAASKPDARRQLGVPETGRYIGCAGGIDRRKGMHLLIRAFLAAADRLQMNDRLLLAGPVEPEIRAILDQEAAAAVRDHRIFVIDRPLTSFEFGLAFRAMDLVATPYPAHPHSASIVIHAAACGRPVLGSNEGWMGRTIRDFHLGATCDVRNLNALTMELVRSLDESGAYRPTEASRRFVRFNTVANFRAHWTRRLRERLNLPVDRNLLEWDSMTDAAPAGDIPDRPSAQATAASTGGAEIND